jgi:hypothetical protein
MASSLTFNLGDSSMPCLRRNRAASFRPFVEMLEVRNLLSTFTVDHLADDMVGQGLFGSLRYCITNATDGDAITFGDGVTGTINLTGALPDLTHSIGIEGPGSDQLTVRRDTGGDYRVFNVDTGTTVVIAGMTISNGFSHDFSTGYGGGIANRGTLTVSNSTVSGNSANDGGGISNFGTLTVTNSTISDNSSADGDGSGDGGGIFNSFGALMLTNCTVSGNSADGEGGGIDANNAFGALANCTVSGNSGNDGGGIANFFGTLTVTNSTITANLAGNSGGGIHSTGYTATLTVSNSTVSGNLRGGGIFNGYTLTLDNSTVSENEGGGIFNGGTLTLDNSTVSGNSATGSQRAGGIANIGAGQNATVLLLSSTIANNTVSSSDSTGSQLYSGRYSGTGLATVQLSNTILSGDGQRPNLFAGTAAIFTSQGHNLSSDDGSGFLTGDGDLINVDPLLGPLQDNGGPTQTMALSAGSPALNAGDPTQLGNSDQRGVVRSGGVNIGAFQASATAFVVNAPDMVQSGVQFDVTVMAVDPFGQVAVGYIGTVTFSTSDPNPGVVLPADYAFVPDDGGLHTFTDTGLGEITLVTPGDQTLTVMDTADSTITGSADLTVSAGPQPGPHGQQQQPATLPASAAQAEPPPRREPPTNEVVAAEQWFISFHDGDNAWLTVPRLRHQVPNATDSALADLLGGDEWLSA